MQIAQVAEKNKMFKAYLKDPTVPREAKKESLGQGVGANGSQ